MLSLNAGSGSVGAIHLIARGPGMTAPAPARSSYQLYWRTITPTEVHAIVLGAVGSGAVLSLNVPDVRRSAEYSVELLDAALASGQPVANLGAYTVTVLRN